MARARGGGDAGPDESDFARVAAKFGATIVPVAAIGAEDGWEMILDADELLALPVAGALSQRPRLEESPLRP